MPGPFNGPACHTGRGPIRNIFQLPQRGPMLRTLTFLLLVSSVLTGFGEADPVRLEAAGLHLALDSSEPAAGAEVHMLHSISLRFTEAPQDNSVSVRLIDSSGQQIETGPVERNADDGAAFSSAVVSHPTPGEYTIAWRAMGSDGHVVRGDFTFSVMAH